MSRYTGLTVRPVKFRIAADCAEFNLREQAEAHITSENHVQTPGDI